MRKYRHSLNHFASLKNTPVFTNFFQDYELLYFREITPFPTCVDTHRWDFYLKIQKSLSVKLSGILMTCLRCVCETFSPAGCLCDMPLTERILSISCDFAEVMSLIRDKPATLYQTSDKALSPQPRRQCQFAVAAVSSCSMLEVNVCYSAFYSVSFSCCCEL